MYIYIYICTFIYVYIYIYIYIYIYKGCFLECHQRRSYKVNPRYSKRHYYTLIGLYMYRKEDNYAYIKCMYISMFV
jgi:hypothetical protein